MKFHCFNTLTQASRLCTAYSVDLAARLLAEHFLHTKLDLNYFNNFVMVSKLSVNPVGLH